MPKQRDDDLFHDSTMTFGEHLEELRSALFKALIALVIGFVIGLFIGLEVVEYIKAPIVQALIKHYRVLAKVELTAYIAEQKELGKPVPDYDTVSYLVEHENLIYEQVYLRPHDVLGQLQEMYPGQFDSVQLPENTGHPQSVLGPGLFIPQDFPNPQATAQALMKARDDAKKPLGPELWNYLGSSGQATVEEIATTEKPSDKQIVAQRMQLVELLNEVLEDDAFDEPANYQGLAFGSIGSRLLKRLEAGQLDPEENLRLRRIAVESTLGESIAPSRAEMVSLFLWRPLEKLDKIRPTTLGPTEAFMIYIKAALVSGAVLSSPWVFYYLWMFVAAGLYPTEKHYVHVFLPFSLGLFLSGAGLAYFFVFEPVLDFLFGFNRMMGFDADPRISEWMSFILMLPIGFGVAFQLPLVMLFLERIGIFTAQIYMEKWRISILVVVVLSAVLTPADPYSMLLLAVPLCVLYFGGVQLCKYLPRRASPFADDANDDL